jgi:asparagine synthase (glutamine-hydrolysing)
LPISGRDYLGRLVRRLPVSHRYASIEFLMQQFVKGLGLSAEVRFMLWMGFYGNSDKKQLFSADLRNELLRKDAFEDVSNCISQSGLKGDFQRLEYLCTKMYLPDDILTKVDRSGMAHSLEVRFPYLDNDVVNYSCRIQPDYKLKGLQTKYVLKRAVRGLLPAGVRLRRKAGFMMPVSMWLAKNMRGNVEELCSPAATGATGLFDPEFVERILSEHFEQRRDHRKHIYPLLCFMAWMQNYGTGTCT